jgi:hypothetical protein
MLIPAGEGPIFGPYPEHTRWIRVPICLKCWLIDLQSSAQSWRYLFPHIDQHDREHHELREIRRRRCLGCGRPLRLYRPSHYSRDLYMNEKVCCSECERKARNERNRVRRRVKQQPMRYLVCRKSFVPTRADAQTCSNTCRQKLFRRLRRKPRPASPAPSQQKTAIQKRNTAARCFLSTRVG